MKKFGKILAIPLALSLALVVPAVAFATESATPIVSVMAEKPPVNDKKVTICHATGSETNPFVEITISENAVDAHFDSNHQRDEDTFGPCAVVVPSASPSVVPTTPAPSPSEEDGKKVTICHATGSESNPFVEITISENAVEAHFRDGHQRGEDVFGPCPTPTPQPSETPGPSDSPNPTEYPKPSESPTATPTTPAPTVEPSVTPTTPAPTPNAPDCPDLSSVGEFFNKSGGQAVLTVTVNGEVAPFSLIGTGRDTPLPGVYEVDATAFEFPGVIHLLDLNVGDAVSVNITDGITSDTDSGVVSVNCSVGLNVGLEKFVAPVVPTNPPVPPVTPTETPTAKPSPSESVTPTVPAVPRAATSTVDVLPFTGINLGVATVVALLLILLGILGMRAGRLRR